MLDTVTDIILSLQLKLVVFTRKCVSHVGNVGNVGITTTNKQNKQTINQSIKQTTTTKILASEKGARHHNGKVNNRPVCCFSATPEQ